MILLTKNVDPIIFNLKQLNVNSAFQ